MTTAHTAPATTPYDARLDELRQAAKEDGIPWNEASEREFRNFAAETPEWRKADLVLMDNGNLRAVWESGDERKEDHLALQFLGNGSAQFVILKQQSPHGDLLRTGGTNSLKGIRQQVSELELNIQLN